MWNGSCAFTSATQLVIFRNTKYTDMDFEIPFGENKDGQETLEIIRRKAAEDPDFRELCLSNPKAAVKKATGIEVPDDFNLRFVENNGADLTVVLPDEEPKSEDDLLSDDDLEDVAGGDGGAQW